MTTTLEQQRMALAEQIEQRDYAAAIRQGTLADDHAAQQRFLDQQGVPRNDPNRWAYQWFESADGKVVRVVPGAQPPAGAKPHGGPAAVGAARAGQVFQAALGVNASSDGRVLPAWLPARFVERFRAEARTYAAALQAKSERDGAALTAAAIDTYSGSGEVQKLQKKAKDLLAAGDAAGLGEVLVETRFVIGPDGSTRRVQRMWEWSPDAPRPSEEQLKSMGPGARVETLAQVLKRNQTVALLRNRGDHVMAAAIAEGRGPQPRSAPAPRPPEPAWSGRSYGVLDGAELDAIEQRGRA